jgi:hypothetical protein
MEEDRDMEAGGAVTRECGGRHFTPNSEGDFSQAPVPIAKKLKPFWRASALAQGAIFTLSTSPLRQNFTASHRSNAYLQEKQPRKAAILPFPRATGHTGSRII